MKDNLEDYLWFHYLSKVVVVETCIVSAIQIIVTEICDSMCSP